MNKIQDVNFLSEIANFIFTDKYARFNELMGRRETWSECVDRVETMHVDKFKKILSKDDIKEIIKAHDCVREKKNGPSMRSMQFGGKAVLAHNPRIFNCAVRHIDSPRAFAEVFYLLLCGCFHPDTEIMTSSGNKKIKDITTDDFVCSYNEHTNKYEFLQPIAVHENLTQNTPKIKFYMEDGSAIVLTENHEVLTKSGYKQAKDISDIDDIVNFFEK